ncbi:MAG: HypC/HybG/HupF family hydrogenase formation chaperone [Nanoarchaeota archaeon]|nr:HypC/HybG/HupF family hydrogenase formation chaperone [Nanoarchaeota archaeon]MBU1854951.1 HypC/HybG/HupF family hydrogenase formation chaperone [Nanoarchaeota archaeon]
MCLSVPGRIVEINGDKAVVDYDGERRVASISLKKDVKVGDYVIVSAKFVMEVIPEEEAKKTLELWGKTDDS